MTTFNEFWGRAGPGLITAGADLYSMNQAQKEAARRLAAAQGPIYQQAMGGAGATLAEAGALNPDALAASRFGAQEAMLKPLQDKQLEDLQRVLYAKGMLGIANYNPGVEGVVPTGQLMNPQMAAFFAAQNADRAKRSQASLLEGQNYANNLVSRAGNLRDLADSTQATGIAGGAQVPSRATGRAEVLKGITGMLGKDPGILKDIVSFGTGMFKDIFGFGRGDVQSAFTSADGLNW